MPEWKALVRERLGDLGLAASQEEIIVAELASHLEEVFDEACAQGFCKSEAIERSLAQVTDWHGLSRNIQRAKREEGTMNHRTKTLWLPGLISLTAAMIFLMVSELFSLQPRFLVPGSFAVGAYRLDQRERSARGLSAVARSFAILRCCWRVFVTPCRRTTSGSPRSWYVSLDITFRFSDVLDADWANRALQA